MPSELNIFHTLQQCTVVVKHLWLLFNLESVQVHGLPTITANKIGLCETPRRISCLGHIIKGTNKLLVHLHQFTKGALKTVIILTRKEFIGGSWVEVQPIKICIEPQELWKCMKKLDGGAVALDWASKFFLPANLDDKVWERTNSMPKVVKESIVKTISFLHFV